MPLPILYHLWAEYSSFSGSVLPALKVTHCPDLRRNDSVHPFKEEKGGGRKEDSRSWCYMPI